MVYEGYQKDYFEKEVIITVAVTGEAHGRETNPNLPLSPEEIAQDIRACEKAGASIAHIHARNEEGKPTHDVERFREVHDTVQSHCDDIILNMTSGGHKFSREERINPVLEIQPEIASLDLGPLNGGQTRSSIKPRVEHEEYAEKMRENGVKPEIELFHPGQLTELSNLIDKGLLASPYYCNIIFGMQTATVPHPRNFVNFVDNLPAETEWTCMAIGRHQLPMTTLGLIHGGHVRVGMEDNVYYRKGQLAQSNAQLVKRVVDLAETLERPVASPAQAREMLELDD